MRSLIHSFQQRLAVGRQRRESEQFEKDLGRFITQPVKMFTLGVASIAPRDIKFKVPENLELIPVPGNYGVAEVFLPCTIGNFEVNEVKPLFWLHVKIVDKMIASVFITETRPYETPSNLSQPAPDAKTPAPPDSDAPR